MFDLKVGAGPPGTLAVVCQLRVTLFNRKAKAFPEASLSCLTSAYISLARTGSQDPRQLERG